MEFVKRTESIVVESSSRQLNAVVEKVMLSNAPRVIREVAGDIVDTLVRSEHHGIVRHKGLCEASVDIVHSTDNETIALRVNVALVERELQSVQRHTHFGQSHNAILIHIECMLRRRSLS